ELLYPFPAEEVQAAIRRYPNLREVVWLQEEPQNMGAWTFVWPRLQTLLPTGVTLRYVGRAESASPAEGLHSIHVREQARILREAVADLPEAPTPAVTGEESLAR
ncbi:MAG: 2-oxoglutarate dehydrogenase E1 component, partial [Chloroflexi bacterium]